MLLTPINDKHRTSIGAIIKARKVSSAIAPPVSAISPASTGIIGITRTPHSHVVVVARHTWISISELIGSVLE